MNRMTVNNTHLNSALFRKDVLLEAGRVSRPPLGLWTQDLTDKFDSTNDSTVLSDIPLCMNNAALIEVLRDNRLGATELCEAQLLWIKRQAEANGLELVGHIAVQPWINIGRLLRYEGDLQRSLSYFSILRDTLEGHAIRFGSITIKESLWLKIVRSNSLLPRLELIYIGESLKSFFAVNDYCAALKFLQEARTLVTANSIVPFVLEHEVITLAKLGKLNLAMISTEHSGWGRSDFSRLVQATYRIALLGALRETKNSRKLFRQLADRVLASPLGTPSDQRVLRYLHYLGTIAFHFAVTFYCERLWRMGLQGSRNLFNVPLQIKFLESLLELTIVEDSESLSTLRQNVLVESKYASLLHARGIEYVPNGREERAFSKLLTRLKLLALQ